MLNSFHRECPDGVNAGILFGHITFQDLIRSAGRSAFAVLCLLAFIKLSVYPAFAAGKPTIVSYEEDGTVYQGEYYDIEVLATGGDLTYRWQAYSGDFGDSKWLNLDDNDVYSGTNSAHFRVDTTHISKENEFDWIRFRCKVSNKSGSTYSREFHVNIYDRQDFADRCELDGYDFDYVYVNPNCEKGSVKNLKAEVGSDMTFSMLLPEMPSWMQNAEFHVENRIFVYDLNEDLTIRDVSTYWLPSVKLKISEPSRKIVVMESVLYAGSVRYAAASRSYLLHSDYVLRPYELVEVSCPVPEAGEMPAQATSLTPGVTVLNTEFIPKGMSMAIQTPFASGRIYRAEIVLEAADLTKFDLDKTKFQINGKSAYVSGIVNKGKWAYIWLDMPQTDAIPMDSAYLIGSCQPVIGGYAPSFSSMNPIRVVAPTEGNCYVSSAVWYRIPKGKSFDDRVAMKNGETFVKDGSYCLRVELTIQEASGFGDQYKFVESEDAPFFMMLNGNIGTETIVLSGGKRVIGYVFFDPQEFEITEAPTEDVNVEVGERKTVPVYTNVPDEKQVRYTWQGRRGTGSWENLVAGGDFFAVDYKELCIVPMSKEIDGTEIRCMLTAYGKTYYTDPVTIHITENLRLPSSILYLTVGEARDAEFDPGNTAEASGVSWSSSDPQVVTVDPSTGKLSAKKSGKAMLTASCSSGKATRQVHVEFKDVTYKDSGLYYYDPVYWAVDTEITFGVLDKSGLYTKFNPQGQCTRAQMVTFLWRYAGSPEPKSTTCKFTDIEKNTYYYKAVLWGTENGIIKGYADNTFRAQNVCSRSQAITFIYRLAGEPKPVTSSPIYPDVTKKTDYYYNAVQWGVEVGVVGGYPDNTFKPTKDCTRCQIVTFLYRYAKADGKR